MSHTPLDGILKTSKGNAAQLPVTPSSPSDRNVLVEKIGGTSMSQFKDVIDNIVLNKASYSIYQKSGYRISKESSSINDGKTKKPTALPTFPLPTFPYGRVFIVSAYGGVTDLLLEGKKSQKPGIYHSFKNNENIEANMANLLQHLFAINKKMQPLGLDIDEANSFIENRVNESLTLLDTLDRVLASGYLLRENILLAAREILAAIGESHSAFNSANIIRSYGIQTQYIDLSGFQDHRPLTIDQRIDEAAKMMNPIENLVIVTGYVKGIEGIMRKYDRGYSDITFSKMAVRMSALEAIIHKEYHLSSADPAIIGEEKAIPVGNTNYDVADQLADVGMEAVHPNASKALEISHINLRVKNTFEPKHSGTLITPIYKGKKAKVEIITGSDRMVLIEIHDPKMVGAIGFDEKLAGLFAKEDLSFTFKSTNANSISQIFWQHKVTDKLVKKLKDTYHTISIEKVAIVCVIGTNIAIPGMLARTANVLGRNNINVKCISQSLRQVNIQFVIARKDYNLAIEKLHQELCEKTP